MTRTPLLRLASLALAAVAAIAAPSPAAAQTKLLRFPDIHDDRVAFCYAGDIWVAPAKGGTATRLTAHPGLELFPRFSPDGKWIAFTGQYDGDEQVYVVPSTGGIPKQLTFYPARGPLNPRWGWDNQVYGWTPDGKRILFRSYRQSYELADPRLYTVGLDGGLPDPLPMPVAGAGDFSPDAKKVAYSPLFRDFRSWKRYEGGWAQDLWIFDLATHEASNVTNNPRADRDPMWVGDRLFFSSDRDGTLNLYSYAIATKETKQLTTSKSYDVRWPACDHKGRIVYELGGELVVYDIAAATSTPIAIQVPNDGVAMRPSRVAAEKQIEDAELSPRGERALFVARGDVFTVPIEKGPTRNLTNSSRSHEKYARWSPDGKKIAFVSDRGGEEEIWIVDQEGKGKPEALTSGGKTMRYAPAWSPDGKKIAFSDKEGRLQVLELAGKKLREVARDSRANLRDYAWSPDSRWLAFSLTSPNGNRGIWIWSAADGKLQRATNGFWNEAQPAWDPEGKYLWYLSDREFAPAISSVEFDYATARTTAIYALTLRKDVANPFAPESDEVKGEDDDAKDKDKDKDKEKGKDSKKEQEPVRIDFDGLAARVVRVPVEASDLDSLVATKGQLLYRHGSAFFYGRDGAEKPSLRAFTLKDRKEETVVEEAEAFAVSRDGEKVLVLAEGNWALYDAKPKAKESKKAVSTKGMFCDRVPAEEWAEIFDEVWRRYRDWFYVENMHGYDWKALGDRYRPLLAHVAHRSDLNYVLSEMVAELNIGHAYIEGGDWEKPARQPVALLGAVLEADAKANRVRIARILRGDNAEERYHSPLAEIGVDVKEGDYLLAIDGTPLTASDDPYRMLRDKADRPVELTVGAKPETAGSRTVKVNPISSEIPLYYFDWVAKNRDRVDRLSGGKLAYLHVPDMGEDGIREFIKWFYPQLRGKDGLLVDDRGNGGGNVSQMLIGRLSRKMLSTRLDRNSQDYETYPSAVFNGPMVCLINETSASDGDIFPAMFRAAKLGPLVGKRTWGGVVGISGHGPLVDGGTVYVPESATNAPNGEYIIEGHGVDPDVVVENDPKSLLDGKDPQLEKAVEIALDLVKKNPPVRPVRPPDPVKTK